jgi:membrane protein YdbS with pleckstrin-like domain
MGFFSTASQRFGIAGELLSFFARNKRWWLLPVVCVVLLAAVVTILAQSSALAPFIYTLF